MGPAPVYTLGESRREHAHLSSWASVPALWKGSAIPDGEVETRSTASIYGPGTFERYSISEGKSLFCFYELWAEFIFSL